MKTIEEAAVEYAAQERTTRSEHVAFVAGAEFAQRWISVEDELPETGFGDKDEDFVLIKGINEQAYKGKYVKLPFVTVTRLRSVFKGKPLWDRLTDGMDKDKRNKVTHWRKIELK